ncbi:tRNA (adenosine(37)-N6)-dimethylallyltransferase MiaA [Asticcacaulis tiandongensis]|uniref:tRNA (adenosine(37)-N6)-dimethylallyltransferase MiaA n=1 Tax=Asticcacaulis tiandongensis TaxID=2565365 RepID=UPI00112DB57B|nr:tRNA (adenosine(37)-N6)-dimethylallyltransferase MiaA [Asticcacaulis tiandongensis]
MSASSPPVFLLAGPTASGKSAHALDWAAQTGGVIVNADSMQLYRDAPLLTARPSAADEAVAPHHLYGILAADQLWSTGDWVRAIRPYIDAALSGGVPLCLVGGTGLYFLSLIRGLSEIPDIDEDVRQKARQAYEEMGEDAFRALLHQHDPDAAARIAPNDRQRLTRALEVFWQTGKPLSVWQQSNTPLLLEGQYELTILKPERDILYARCDQRFKLMIQNGALAEVESLVANGLKPDWPILRVLGLNELWAYLRDEMSLEAAIALAQQKTRNYAKRQTTFFGNQFKV